MTVDLGPDRLQQTTAAAGGNTSESPLRPFVFDLASTPGRTTEELLGASAEAEALFDLFGRELVTKTLVQSEKLSLYHHTVPPGQAVKPHRHGTHQATFVLRGELIFGSRRVGPGMGYFSPDRLYAWRAGDEGAEWIEVHAGPPGVYTDPPQDDRSDRNTSGS